MPEILITYHANYAIGKDKKRAKLGSFSTDGYGWDPARIKDTMFPSSNVRTKAERPSSKMNHTNTGNLLKSHADRTTVGDR